MELQSAKKWSLRQLCTNSITNLPPLGQIDVGRSKSSNLCLEFAFLSSRHAAFVVNCYGNLLLRDLLSKSGTFVNKHLLLSCKNKLLAHGDVVSFGTTNYNEHSMPEEMKECFFEVIADDRPSAMGNSTMGEDLTATVGNNEKNIIQSYNEDTPKPVEIIDSSKELAEVKEIKKEVQHSNESKQNPNKSDGVFKKPAKVLNTFKRCNSHLPIRSVPTFVAGSNIANNSKNTLKTIDSIKQNAERKNKLQPIKPIDEKINPIKSLDSSKQLSQRSTPYRGKKPVEPLKTFDELMKMKGKEKSINAINPTEFQSKPENKKTSSTFQRPKDLEMTSQDFKNFAQTSTNNNNKLISNGGKSSSIFDDINDQAETNILKKIPNKQQLEIDQDEKMCINGGVKKIKTLIASS